MNIMDFLLDDAARGIINWKQLEYELDVEAAFYDETLERAIKLLTQLRELTPDDGDRNPKRYEF
jgi:hypothetical protein